MKVYELKKQLEKIDPELEVIFSTEDKDFLREGHRFTLFDFIGIDVTEAEFTRNNEIPSLKLGKSHYSRKLAAISITSEF